MPANENRSPVVGIIGGSGVYALDGLTNARKQKVASPFGEPSDEILTGELDGVRLAFLPRHGKGHRIPPSEINFRANIDALKRLGVTDIISLSAVGSMKEELPPGTFVVVDQFIDRTHARTRSFFGTGCVGHVSMAQPVCRRLGDALEAAGREAGTKLSRGGAYLVIEGPQFSTLAESQLYRSWGTSVIGMTNMPEARLAREAEICYATVAMVTDFDTWHAVHETVSVQQVVATMNANAAAARALLALTVPKLGQRPECCPHGCDRALDSAIMTAKEARDPKVTARLDAVAGRVL